MKQIVTAVVLVVLGYILAGCSAAQLQQANATLAAGCRIGAPTGNAIAAGSGNAAAVAGAAANTVFCTQVEAQAAAAASAPHPASAP